MYVLALPTRNELHAYSSSQNYLARSVLFGSLLSYFPPSFLLDFFPRRGDRPMFPSVFFIISYAFCSFSLPPGGGTVLSCSVPRRSCCLHLLFSFTT